MIFNQDYVFENNQIMHFCINRLEFYLKYSDTSWKLSYRFLEEKADALAETVDEYEKFNLETWVFEKSCQKIKFKPVMPDKPVLTEFKNPTYVLPGQSINLFEIVPLMVDLIIETDTQVSLKKLPVYPFPLTWLGSMAEGEVCYHDEAETLFKESKIAYEQGSVICPIEIHNGSGSSFSLKQLCIRTEYLSIYQKDQVLWSDKMKIDYQGEDKDAPLEIISNHSHHQGSQKISHSRETLNHTHKIFKRFSNFKSLMS